MIMGAIVLALVYIRFFWLGLRNVQAMKPAVIETRGRLKVCLALSAQWA